MKDEDFAQLKKTLIGSVCKRFPSLCSEAEDIAQEVFLSIVRRQEHTKLKRERGDAYFAQAACNKAIDLIRKRLVRKERPLEDVVEVWLDADDPLTPEQHYESRQSYAMIRRCLELMDAPRRRAVELKILGETAKQSAKILRWTRRQVENRVFRGIRDLRDCLSFRGIGP